ncbi:hypothetical protein HPB47_014073 [Ixodes persulcatus]|uniref:Uncharacterized protein n=1 Tax=Ixodes persulcatus TaxID=34615 RepID=A0AC60QYS4_IXOPE|nr:hypothetical protein HPB47_014073 [Ixodes persulcatus]
MEARAKLYWAGVCFGNRKFSATRFIISRSCRGRPAHPAALFKPVAAASPASDPTARTTSSGKRPEPLERRRGKRSHVRAINPRRLCCRLTQARGPTVLQPSHRGSSALAEKLGLGARAADRGVRSRVNAWHNPAKSDSGSRWYGAPAKMKGAWSPLEVGGASCDSGRSGPWPTFTPRAFHEALRDSETKRLPVSVETESKQELTPTVRGKITVEKIPRNVNSERNANRRRVRAQTISRIWSKKPGTLYADAAILPRGNTATLAVADPRGNVVRTASVYTTLTEHAEEAAIALAATGTKQDHITVITDSQRACRNFAKGEIGEQAARILSKAKFTSMKVVWAPGHAGVEGNEAANAAARAFKECMALSKTNWQQRRRESRILGGQLSFCGSVKPRALGRSECASVCEFCLKRFGGSTGDATGATSQLGAFSHGRLVVSANSLAKPDFPAHKCRHG